MHCISYHSPPPRVGFTSSTCWRTTRPASPSSSPSSLRPSQSAGSMDSGSKSFAIIVHHFLTGISLRTCTPCSAVDPVLFQMSSLTSIQLVVISINTQPKLKKSRIFLAAATYLLLLIDPIRNSNYFGILSWKKNVIITISTAIVL